VVSDLRGIERVTRPNLATFVVGVIATSAGAVLAVRGAGEPEAANPFLLGGAAALAGGLPFAIGPWIGNGTELRPAPDAAPTRRPGPTEPCGERPVAARAATLDVRGAEVYGRVDAAGVLAVSLYHAVDAFDVTAAAGLDLTAELEAPGGARKVQAVQRHDRHRDRAPRRPRHGPGDAGPLPRRAAGGCAPMRRGQPIRRAGPEKPQARTMRGVQ
jgi:hypothetical protein